MIVYRCDYKHCDQENKLMNPDDVVYTLAALVGKDNPMWTLHFHWDCLYFYLKRERQESGYRT